MRLAQALSYTANELNSMKYDELAEVTKALAEAARRRISRLPAGPAYVKLKQQALGSGRVPKVSALSFRDDTVRISQNFRGRNKMSFNDLRQLRKSLSNYINNPTSTNKGYKELRERAMAVLEEKRQNKVIKDLQDSWMSDMSDWDAFDEYLADDDLITFGKNHLDWASDQIYNIIIESGGYKARDSKDPNVKAKFKRRLREHTALQVYKKSGSRKKDESGKHYSLLNEIDEELAEPMPRFFY